VSGWLVVMHTYLCYFRLWLSHCAKQTESFRGDVFFARTKIQNNLICV